MRSFEIDPDYMQLNVFFFFFLLGKLEIRPEMVTLVGVLFYCHCNCVMLSIVMFKYFLISFRHLEATGLTICF